MCEFADVNYSVSAWKLNITRLPMIYKQTTHILRNITGSIPDGTLTAVIGKSGSGKTTFLQILSNVSKLGKTKGYLSTHANRDQIVFVSQIPNLPQTETVAQLITFACYATLERYASQSEITVKVDTILQDLSLAQIRNRQIRYLSGGEKKRVSIGMQLLRNPRVLVLDEPLSGLDSVTGLSLLTTLKALSSGNNKLTVVISLHQPSNRMIAFIDHLISLKEGQIVFDGPPHSAIESRKSLLDKEQISDGQCNAENCADYLIETEYLIETPKLSTHSFSQSQSYLQLPKEESLSLSKSETETVTIGNNKHFKVRQTWNVFLGLSARGFRHHRNHATFVVLNLLFNVLTAVALGKMYDKFGRGQIDIRNRFGSLAFCLLFIGIQSVSYAGQLFEDRKIFIDEYNAKLYGEISYLFAQFVPALIILRIIPTMVFTLIFFSMVGYQSHTFGEFLLVTVLLSCVATLSVYTLSTFCTNLYSSIWASLLLNLTYLVFGGMFRNAAGLPLWIAWLNYCSFYKFAYEIVMVNEFTGLWFDMDASKKGTVTVNGVEINTGGSDVDLSGDFFLSFFGLDKDNLAIDYAALCAWMVAYFVIAVLSLRYLNRTVR